MGNQYTSARFDQLGNAKKYINAVGLEYAGGFVNIDDFVTVRCPKCGTTFRKSMVTIRHRRNIICPGCREAEAARTRQKAEAEQRARDINAARKRFGRQVIKGRQLNMAECRNCGRLFVRTRSEVYCSELCAKRAANTVGKDKRVKKIRGAMVDRNITIERLYNDAGGVCALCGEACDWMDFEVRPDGTMVAGNRYPSIDHIVPLSRGGRHAWDNVQLAHRICNTLKGNR